LFHSSTGDERIATQLRLTGVTIAGITNKKTPNYSGLLYVLTKTVMTYSTPKEFVCHHHV